MKARDVDSMLLEKFKVVIPPQHRCATTCAELRITPSQFVFNRMTAAELAYPEHICCLLSDDNTQMAIRPTAPNEYSIPFCRIGNDNKLAQKGAITICNKALIKNLRSVLGWEPVGNYVIQALKYPEANLLLFDFSKAYIRKKDEKKREISFNILDSYPPLSQVVKNYRQLALMPPKQNVKTGEGGGEEAIDVEFNAV